MESIDKRGNKPITTSIPFYLWERAKQYNLSWRLAIERGINILYEEKREGKTAEQRLIALMDKITDITRKNSELAQSLAEKARKVAKIEEGPAATEGI